MAARSSPSLDDGGGSFEDTDPSLTESSQTPEGSQAADTTVDKYGFLRKSDSDIGGSHLSVKLLRRRELKWLEMINNWDHFMAKKHNKVRERCRKGIPSSLRARAWCYLSGAKHLMDRYKSTFTELDGRPGDPRCEDDIRKDLHRQFPSHELFCNEGGTGQEDLFRVLKAYSLWNPNVGYCQAQAPLAATLLMHLPAEAAFWCLVCICERYIPGYFDPGLEVIQMDGNILFGLLKKFFPAIYRHFKQQKVEPVCYMTEWFMCVYSRTLNWALVLRVWDMFLCEGVKVLFRVALVILHAAFSETGAFKKYPSLYEILHRLKTFPHEITDEEVFMSQVISLNLTEEDLKKEHQRQALRWRHHRNEPERHNGYHKSKAS